MFLDIETALNYLENKKNKHNDRNKFKKLLAKYQNIQENLKCIHIAGTNGKGSTSFFINNILLSAGYKVGLFTSPYLICHNDRIRINNEYISDAQLLAYINYFYADIEEYDLSMFEIDMLISIFYFYENKVDYCVYEVGMGGRLDATNVIKSEVSVITNIGYDHMNYLGSTLEKIALEKAGIIKENQIFITAESNENILELFKKICLEKNTIYQKIDLIKNLRSDLSFDYLDIKDLKLSMPALYQVKNAALAISTIKSLNLEISNETIKKGIYESKWLGRFEEMIPNVYIDGAHNVDSIMALKQTLETKNKKIKIIFSALNDKNFNEMLKILLEITNDITLTQFDFYRAFKLAEIENINNLKTNLNYQEAIEDAIKELKADELLVITGSLYFISIVRKYLLKRKEN